MMTNIFKPKESSSMLVPLLLLLLSSSLMAAEGLGAPDSDGYKLVWSDEFDVDGPPNPEVWNFEEGFQRNHEHQWYQKQNAWVEDGILIFEARKEKRPNPNYKRGSHDWKKNRKFIEYTSSSINSKGKKSFKYGRFVVRAKIDVRMGMWPAIWTIGDVGEWPSNGEIDIMEYYNGYVLGNAVWGTKERYKGHWDAKKVPLKDLGGKKWADEFHVWRMDWDINYIRLYVDDFLVNEIEIVKTFNDDPKKFGGPANPFRQPHFLLLNLALGGDNGGDPNKADWPGRYLVDYVRIYQTDAPQPEALMPAKATSGSVYKALNIDTSGEKDAIGIHHYSELGRYINKKIGWGADCDTEEFVWENAASIKADTRHKTEGKISYKFTLKKDWARWVLKMKGEDTLDFSSYKALKFDLSSKSAAKWKKFTLIMEDANKTYVSIPMKDIGFKADGKFHTVTVQMKALENCGLDLSKMNNLVQIAWDGGVRKGHNFHLDALRLVK